MSAANKCDGAEAAAIVSVAGKMVGGSDVARRASDVSDGSATATASGALATLAEETSGEAVARAAGGVAGESAAVARDCHVSEGLDATAMPAFAGRSCDEATGGVSA